MERETKRRDKESERERHKGRLYDKVFYEKYAYVALDHDLIYHRQTVQEKA